VSGDWFTLRWSDPVVEMLDQRRLPEREQVLRLTTVEEVAQAIEDLAVRGAPAIGCAAGLGIALAARTAVAADADALARVLDLLVDPAEPLIGMEFSIAPMTYQGKDTDGDYLFSNTTFSIGSGETILANGTLSDIHLEIDECKLSFDH